MKKFIGWVRTIKKYSDHVVVGSKVEFEFVVDDNANSYDIAQAAEEASMNCVEYDYEQTDATK